MLRDIGGLLLSLVFLFVSAHEVYTGWKNREAEPTRTTVADYVKSDQSKKWVVLTDAKINLLDAVTVTTTVTTTHYTTTATSEKNLTGLYIPIESAGSTQNDTVSLLLETDDAEILNVARQLKAKSEAKSEAELLQFIVREKDKLIRSVELSGLIMKTGLMERGREAEIRKRIKNLADDFYILKHNSTSSQLKEGVIVMGVSLLILIGSIYSLRSKLGS